MLDDVHHQDQVLRDPIDIPQECDLPAATGLDPLGLVSRIDTDCALTDSSTEQPFREKARAGPNIENLVQPVFLQELQQGIRLGDVVPVLLDAIAKDVQLLHVHGGGSIAYLCDARVPGVSKREPVATAVVYYGARGGGDELPDHGMHDER